MSNTPDSLPETPDYGRAGTERTDILSVVLRAVRLSGSFLFRGEFSSPWSCAAPDSRVVAPFLVPGAKCLVFFHVVTDGHCWAEVEKQKPVMLGPGDVIALPYGDAHAMANPRGGKRTPMSALLPPPPWPDPPTVVHGGGGEVTRVLCGFLHCDDALLSPMLTNLPRVLCVRARSEPSWLELTTHYMLEEASHPRPGSACLLGRLAELLFVEVLRRHMEELGEHDIGWLAALNDSTVGKALQLMHGDLARPWTVERLGRCVGLSRSALADRFRHLLGEPPMQYLTRWRLQTAAQRLRDTDEGIAAIAAAVGYESEAAFNRAFKRHVGEPPATWRSGARARTLSLTSN
jgi:AraC-like DNA-binding protein